MSNLDDRLKDEAEANLFAMLLLIPEDFLKVDLAGYKCIDYEDSAMIGELAEKYGVSKQLMTIRIAAFLET